MTKRPDPIRLLDVDSGASAELRALLQSAIGDGPSRDQETGLAVRLAPLVGVPALHVELSGKPLRVRRHTTVFIAERT